MRVGIIALLQESNTFIHGVTTLAHFQQDLLAEGEEMARKLKGAHHETGGFFAALEEEGIEAVPIFAARALPYGIVTADALNHLLEKMLRALIQAGQLDGVLVAPHGATVSEQIPDVDGHWLSLVRSQVGSKIPIIGTLDPHGNLSPRMVLACDALISYRSNPHLDQFQRGQEAARLMARTLRKEIRPTMAAQFPPLAVNIERQLTSALPFRTLYEEANAMLQIPGVLSNSIMLSFPYADVPEMGAAVIVVTDNNMDQAQTLSRDLAKKWWDRRHEFVGQLISIEDAMEKCKGLEGPICLLDMGDNVGGGSPADGTELVHALSRHPLRPAFACLYDPECVQLAKEAGIGTKLSLRVGGKTDHLHGEPFASEFKVLGLYDGKFEEPLARHGGFKSFDQGLTAVLETASGLTLMLTSRRMVPFSIHQLTDFGIDPAKYRILVAKGVHAPVAAYAPVSKHLLRVDTPGVTRADLTKLTYHHRRKPMFPFEENTIWDFN